MGEALSIRSCSLLLAVLLILLADGSWANSNTYFGRLVGTLSSQYHGVRGDVYAVDARTLFIKGFYYDGKGQDTVFYAGSSSQPGTDGFVIPNEDGSTESLSRSYNNQDLTLTLPEGKTIKEIRWLSVYNRAYSEAYGEVRVPSGFDYPRPQRLNAMSGIHQVNSDRIYVVDAQTFLVPNFTYDGAAPDAFFWVGTGSKPGQSGVKVPDENGKLDPLRRYDTKTLVLTLPGELTVFDVEWLSVWCQAFGIDFGHIRIPKNLNVPPSLKMLGVAPQSFKYTDEYPDDNNEMPSSGNRRLLSPPGQRRVAGYQQQQKQQQQRRQQQQPDPSAHRTQFQPYPAYYSRSSPTSHFRAL